MSDDIFGERPQEFFQANFLTNGYCDAQTILPVDGHYECHCTCGRWDVVADDEPAGLALAREHTRDLTDRLLAQRSAS